MSLDPAAVKQYLASKKAVATGSASGGGDTVLFGPVAVPREDLVSDLIWLHSITKADDFEGAVSMAWHKVSDIAGREKMSRIVTYFRLSQDGKSRPKFLFIQEYRKISGAPEDTPTLVLQP